MCDLSNRDSNRIDLPRAPRIKLYLNNCLATCVKIYNALPSDIKRLPLNKFNKEL